ncbi:hypothetical protein JGS22_003525 [Streptomyces sp. P38-E01]|uniref:Uncharacterized protein n=1 Tax=Streptomyces tardus TaxID=2780544 RepID=A0A949JAZ5_9ACTN|nr:hypothetical protein [Streptomyces tardus]MBU7596732.1 hypothetical protein [Streptomyces tardus]
MSEFIMPAGEEAHEILLDIAEEMVTIFHISRAEAVARINQAWGTQSFDEEPILLGHELPEHWAYAIYYVGDVPYWEAAADRSQWQVKEPPPSNSPMWTINPDA